MSLNSFVKCVDDRRELEEDLKKKIKDESAAVDGVSSGSRLSSRKRKIKNIYSDEEDSVEDEKVRNFVDGNRSICTIIFSELIS